MVEESRLKIYDYLYNIFYGVVTKNVYAMSEPQELTKSDAKEGFIVIRVGDLFDESEFSGHTYGWARCYVEAYIPAVSRFRLDYDKYQEYEDGINAIIKLASEDNQGTYHIQEGSVLSMDGVETTNAGNPYFSFIKSFIVNIETND